MSRHFSSSKIVNKWILRWITKGKILLKSYFIPVLWRYDWSIALLLVWLLSVQLFWEPIQDGSGDPAVSNSRQGAHGRLCCPSNHCRFEVPTFLGHFWEVNRIKTGSKCGNKNTANKVELTYREQISSLTWTYTKFQVTQQSLNLIVYWL